jgi:hypothetical protein
LSLIIKPLGYADLLIPIQEIMDTSLGPITFGNFTRLQREKLCTHGDLSFASLDQYRDKGTKKKGKQAKAIPFLPEAIKKHNILMDQLCLEVERLRGALEVIIEQADDTGV